MGTANPEGPEIAGYTWREFLGRGGSADVHLYRQHVPKRDVAIKVLRQQEGPRAAAAIRREANVLAQVSSHPGIVSLYATGRTDSGAPWMALEACRPPIWERGGTTLSLVDALRYGVIMAGALATLHSVGIVHRDVKPANILVTEFGAPVLTDFGISGATGLPMRPGEGGLSVPWAAPEVHYEQITVSPAQDVYSLAATIWTWLAGTSPFEIPGGDNSRSALVARVLSAPISGIGRRDVPESVEQLLMRAMSRDAANRPSAADFGRMLQQQQRELGIPETELEIRSFGTVRQGRAAVESADDPDATRIRPVSVISAATTRQQSFDFSDPPMVRHLSESIHRSSDTETASRAAAPRRASVVGNAIAIAAGVLIAGVLMFALLRGGGWTITPTANDRNQGAAEDVAPTTVPRVSGLKLTVNGNDAVATWQAPPDVEEMSGKPFGYRVERAGHDTIIELTAQNSVKFPIVSGSNCIEVWVRGADGQVSASQRACLTH